MKFPLLPQLRTAIIGGVYPNFVLNYKLYGSCILYRIFIVVYTILPLQAGEAGLIAAVPHTLLPCLRGSGRGEGRERENSIAAKIN